MEQAPQYFKLSQHLPDSNSFNAKEIEFARLATEASECLPGDLFIALVSAEGDGHNDIQLAIKNGAVGIVAERLLPTTFPLFVVDDTRTAFSNLSQVVYGRSAPDLFKIAVIGSSGVSAATDLIAHILETSQLNCEVIASPADSSSLESFTHHTKRLGDLAQSETAFAILEITTEQLASRLYDTLAFDLLVVTSVEIHSQDFAGTPQAYINSYQRAFDRLRKQGVAVLNFCDPITRFEFVPENRAFLSIGLNDESDIWVQHLEHGRSGQAFRIHAGADVQDVFSPILGYQHVFNCLMGVAVGLLLDLPFQELCDSIATYENAPGHLERVSLNQNFDVYVDHANTARDLNKAVLALRQVSEGRLILVYGPSARHTASERAEMGRIAERFADLSIITENNAEYEDPLTIAHDVLDGYLRSADAYVIPGRERAIAFALTMAEEHDVVLIAGKGSHKFDRLGKETYYFDDVEIASICIDEILNPVAKYGRDIFRFDDYTNS